MAVSRVQVGGRQQVLDHGLPPGQLDLVHAVVGLGEGHPDALGERGGDVLADVVGADRQLPVTAVDQHRELHRAGPADVVERVQRGPHGAAGEEHVVDQDHPAAVDAAAGQLGLAERAGGVQPQVVAVEGDVERADRDVDAFECVDAGGEPGGERDARGWGCRAARCRWRRRSSRGSGGRSGRRPGAGRTRREWSCWRCRRVGMPRRTSFPASRDGSLKDVGSRQPPWATPAGWLTLRYQARGV